MLTWFVGLLVTWFDQVDQLAGYLVCGFAGWEGGWLAVWVVGLLGWLTRLGGWLGWVSD